MLENALRVCFQNLNTYSKKPSDLPSICNGFIFILGDYDADSVQMAFKTHLKQSSLFPTPSDIVKIISPPDVKFDRSMYISCKQWIKENESAPFSLKERDCLKYIKAYEGRELEILDEENDHKDNIKISDSRVSGLINNLTKEMK